MHHFFVFNYSQRTAATKRGRRKKGEIQKIFFYAQKTGNDQFLTFSATSAKGENKYPPPPTKMYCILLVLQIQLTFVLSRPTHCGKVENRPNLR